MKPPKFTLSLVSHGHAAMLPDLLEDIRALTQRYGHDAFELMLTFNIPEDDGFIYRFRDLPLTRIDNVRPVGFGANQNAAFKRSRGPYFVILNPDARISSVDFDVLVAPFGRAEVGAVAPRVVDSAGALQDSARRFPTIPDLLRRVLTSRRECDYPSVKEPTRVDWVAGMFAVFRREAWASVGGFDERFFMYFEDVDLCRRLQRAGWTIVYQPATSIVHDAQRASHSRANHLRWHLRSAARYFLGI
jgi:N-acetylglucosaminyl-diphospho-decaprenol L-rhamnosyltransferase